ncbi:hypothetical protein NDU88_003398 [Pleurodeles waltl]|uniref:Uncharacterized protein n=1 Tax=Pleurodeles waltl TaxID=8319 RepID=A0AAV7QFL5_PLEWA|nr:hypothetical protein NDU88_003398 [Pleurodeles waltl]
MASVSSMIATYEKYFNPKTKYDIFCGPGSSFKEDTVQKPLKWLVKIFNSGKLKGDSFMQIGMTYLIHLLLPATKAFNEIFVADVLDINLQAGRKWQEKEPGAIDISSAVKVFCELEGHGEKGIEKEDELRRKNIQQMKCDITAKDPLLPKILPPVDCLFLVHCLETFSPDKETYPKLLKNISTLLESGGNLLMIVWLNCTFFMVESFKVTSLCVDDGFVRKVLTETGFVIEEFTVVPRSEKNLYSLTDASSALYVVAKKV